MIRSISIPKIQNAAAKRERIRKKRKEKYVNADQNTHPNARRPWCIPVAIAWGNWNEILWIWNCTGGFVGLIVARTISKRFNHSGAVYLVLVIPKQVGFLVWNLDEQRCMKRVPCSKIWNPRGSCFRVCVVVCNGNLRFIMAGPLSWGSGSDLA